MSEVHSATGPIDSSALGFTLMHEHVLVASAALRQQYPERFDRSVDLARAVANLSEARAAGVRTIVDLTPISLGRDPAFIREAALASGMQVIVATGLYWFPELAFVGMRTDAIADWFVSDIEQGIGETRVRAGVIKCATEPVMDRFNARVLRASARAHRRTGVPICTHSYPANRTGLDQLQVFRDEGVDPGRVVIGHSDDSEDIDYLDELIQSGA